MVDYWDVVNDVTFSDIESKSIGFQNMKKKKIESNPNFLTLNAFESHAYNW